MLAALQNNIAAAIGFLIGAVVAGLLAFIVYEGVPIGPLARIPLVGPILSDLTGGRVDDVRREALKGYVLETRLAAAEAKLAETQRQLEAGRKAAEGYAALLVAAQAENAAQSEREESYATDYEKALGDRGRLGPADVEYILRN